MIWQQARRMQQIRRLFCMSVLAHYDGNPAVASCFKFIQEAKNIVYLAALQAATGCI